MEVAQVNHAGQSPDDGVELKSIQPAHARLTVKHGAHFLVLSLDGMMPNEKSAGYGLYRDDTRYLNSWDVGLNGLPLRLLYSDTTDGYRAKFVYGNNSGNGLEEQTILVTRDIVIADDRVHERLQVRNCSLKSVQARLRVRFAADFADMFEVRGTERKRRGEPLSVELANDRTSVLLGYRGLDSKLMQTSIKFARRAPDLLNESSAAFTTDLKPGASEVVEAVVSTAFNYNSNAFDRVVPSFDEASRRADTAYQDWRAAGATITTSDERVNRIIDRAFHDLYMLRQPTPRGMCLAAGLPWFAVAFGRDQCIAAMQSLSFLPQIARDVITVLAAYQAKTDDVWTAQERGKIMHELRLGEMARLREIPFIPYYGTVDATQLWLMLLCRYVTASNDLELAGSLWKNVRLAASYLTRATKRGYIYYGDSSSALANQGWKDSGDSIMHSDGALAKPPIAVCEAQGYLYEAWSGLSVLAGKLGRARESRTFARKAAALKKRFVRDFWMKVENFVALALDGTGKQCDVVSSNPGHLLGCGILEPWQEAAVAERLAAPDMFCGWGIRTLSASAKAYNPMSYHNGSVWPHDNSIVVAGLCRTGHRETAARVLESMVAAASAQSDSRLPELFSGFDREEMRDQPVRYPVSCVPQAWAAGSILLMLSSLLGMEVTARGGTLRVSGPYLPEWLKTVRIDGLTVGNCRVSLEFQRSAGSSEAACRVIQRSGDVSVEVA